MTYQVDSSVVRALDANMKDFEVKKSRRRRKLSIGILK